MTLHEQFEDYVAYMRRNSRSPASIRSYQRTYILYTADGYTKITTENAEAFLHKRYDSNAATYNKALNHLRSFVRYANRRGPTYAAINIESFMVEQRKIELKLPATVDDLITNKLSAKLKERDLKSWAFLELARNTGMRFSEIHKLRRTNLAQKNDTTFVQFKGKGNVERVVPLNPNALEAFNVWVKGHDFPHPNTIRYHWKQAEIETGIPHVLPHHLRHTVATKLDSQDVPTERIADLLGNTVEVTRSRYRRTDPEKLATLTGALA